MNDCNYCGNSDSIFKYATADLWGNHYNLRKCHACKAFFLTPFPTPEMFALAYDETYYGCSEKKFKGPVEKVLDFFRKQRAKRISKLLPKNGRILDIGCGNGHFLMSLLEHGSFQLHGSELQGKSALRAAQYKEIKLFTGYLSADSFADEKFDVITMFHVFEHLTQPQIMLELVKSYLVKGGYFVVSFPNIGSWQSRFFKGKWLHLDPPRHLFFFETECFVALMKLHGFELVKKHFFSLEQNPYGFVQSFLNLFLKKREILFESLKGNTAYTADYSSAHLFFQKLVFVFLFPVAIVGDIFASLFRKGATVEFTLRKL